MVKIGFYTLHVPGHQTWSVPRDISVRVPRCDDVAADRLHLLAYISWNERYLRHVPARYRAFFKFVLPHLHTRTTDVHTALSLSFLPRLTKSYGRPLDERLLYLALIVHDCGWSKVSRREIADSLDYTGIAFTPNAAVAKFKHTIYGSALAFELLGEFPFDPPLTFDERRLISDIVRFHEHPERYYHESGTPAELILACEADRLWPFTHENFWLDTIRKGVEPRQYIKNAAAAVDEMLLTDAGKKIARRLITERREEVAMLAQLSNNGY